MMQVCDPAAWFWIVGADASKAWSSAAGAYVTQFPADRAIHVASEDALSDALRPFGLTLPKPNLADYTVAIQGAVDATAKAKNYTDGVSLASYASSTNAQWAAEAAAFIAWRDQVWASAYATMAAVESGQQARPTIEGLLTGLPAISWPT